MKHQPFGSLAALSTFLAVIAAWSCTSKPATDLSRVEFLTSVFAACGHESDIRVAIEKLSFDGSQANQAGKILLDRANESPACRKEIIGALIQAMNKPNLNFVSDQRSYFLWSNGSAILGELRAVEALDLLIDHLDLNDGFFSASMVHQPAVLGVKAIGAEAVPKLGTALQHNANRNIRLAAALCLVDMGGPVATDALKQALTSESDRCVRRFITLAIERPGDGIKSKSRPSKIADDADILGQRLLAFRCDN